MPTVLITGGSGLIGQALSKKLIEKGYSVSILTTDKERANGLNSFFWDPDKDELDKKAIEGIDHIIHLAGANIGEKSWSEKRKQLIIDSRIKSTNLLFENIQRLPKNLKTFISASAVGYYGAITSEKIFTENDAPASDFLGEVCKQWEEAADQFLKLNIRTVKLRTGVVLSENGGALEKIVGPVKLGIGSALGKGKQFMPWIHIDDLCDIYIKAIEDNEMKGAYNAVAPEHVNNKEFMRSLSQVLRKPFWFPNVPAFLLKLALGQMSDLVLKGSRVSSDKICSSGFHFKFPMLQSALEDLFKTNKQNYL